MDSSLLWTPKKNPRSVTFFNSVIKTPLLRARPRILLQRQILRVEGSRRTQRANRFTHTRRGYHARVREHRRRVRTSHAGQLLVT